MEVQVGKKVISERMADDVIEAYTANEKYSVIQKAFDLTRIEINDLLLEYGIPRRGTPHKPTCNCLLPEDARQCVIGGSGRCNVCGWNEQVHKIRVAKIRNALEEETKSGE